MRTAAAAAAAVVIPTRERARERPPRSKNSCSFVRSFGRAAPCRGQTSRAIAFTGPRYLGLTQEGGKEGSVIRPAVSERLTDKSGRLFF